MHTKRRPWRPQLTRAEMGRGWVFFALYLTVFPLSMGWVQRAFHGELPVAEANVVYYLLAATLVFLVFWTFLRHGFDLLLDWLPENLFAFGTGLVGAGVLHLLVMLIPLPVQNPNPESYAHQFALSPAATVSLCSAACSSAPPGGTAGCWAMCSPPWFLPFTASGSSSIPTARWISATCCCSSSMCPCPWP